MNKKLKFVGFVVLALVVGITFTVSPFHPVQAQDVQSPNSLCNSCEMKNKVYSQGTPQEEQSTLELLMNSDKFEKVKTEIIENNGEIDKENAVVNVLENKQATVTLPIKNAKNGLEIVSFFVDLNNGNVAGEQKQYFKKISDNKLQIEWKIEDKPFLMFAVNKEGKIVEDNGRQLSKPLSPTEYKAMKEKEMTQKMMVSEEVSPAGTTCAWAMSVLCGAATSGQCLIWCLPGGALAGFFGAGACGIICSAIFGGTACWLLTELYC